MKKKNQKISLGQRVYKANPQKLVVLRYISLRALACRSTISGYEGSVTFLSVFFFPFMEFVVLAVDFVELSPSHESEILRLGNFEKRLSKIKV